MGLDPEVIETIKHDWLSAPTGAKSNIISKWAGQLDCSYQTLYRKLSIGRPRKKGDRKIENIGKYVQIVAQIKKMPPENKGEITTEQAVRIAVKSGLIPQNMNGRAATFDRIIRETGLGKKQRRIQRFQAEYANQLHHIDASTSDCFYVHRETEDKKDFILRLHAGSKTGYKNKPVPIRLRPWVYGLVDDYSGYHTARYVAAFGETAIDNFQFLEWAWSKNEDKALFGLPDKIKGDLGPMMRGPAAKDFFDRLSVEIDASMPENKESHGKIERPWRTAWQRFEKPFFVQPDWRKFEITMSELNRQFFNYQQEYNNFKHRYEKDITRRQAWMKINLRGGAVSIPEKALSTIVRRDERKVGADGCFSLNNKTYEVKGLYDARVYVYQGVFEGKLVVEDCKTREKYEVKDFAPNLLGTYTGYKTTPHQQAVKDAKDLAITNTLYETARDTGNVAVFPTRVKEIRQINDHLFVADTYRSVQEAIEDFISISGIFLNSNNRESIKHLIIENGLDRNFVRELAVEAQAETTIKVNEWRY
jgi:hypothetical protein